MGNKTFAVCWAAIAVASLCLSAAKSVAQTPPASQRNSPQTESSGALPDASGLPRRRDAGAEPFPEKTDEPEEREESRFADSVETDRDAVTPQVRTVERGRFILESAYSFIDNRAVPETHSVPELLVRYGLTRRVELRLGWNYEVGGGGNDVSAGSAQDALVDEPTLVREQRLAYGCKLQLSEQQDWRPATILIVQAFTPTGGASNYTAVVNTFGYGWKLPNRWRLDGSLRYALNNDEGDNFNLWAPSVVVRMPLTERWQVHGEYFSLFAQGLQHDFSRHYFSPGMHFLITPDLEVGVRVGWGLNEQASRFFTNVGFGYRF